jgi:hypothetical protein
VDETVVLARVIEGELPFTLNLPEGTYPVLIDGDTYHIELQQNRIGVPVGRNAMLVGPLEDVRAQLGDRWETSYVHELRTIVRNRREVTLRTSELREPTPEELFEAAQTNLLRLNPPGSFPGGPEEIQREARTWLDRLAAGERTAFAATTSIRLTAAATFPRTEAEQFCCVLNVLIRLYMARFNDRFVQEVTEGMFSATAMWGLRVSLYCNGHEFDSAHHAGGFVPFLIARPWWNHPEPDVVAFRSQLASSPTPDPVTLLHVRARSMLLRGAYRSAVLEASAAFDLCLARKIRAGLRGKGKADAEIEAILAQKENKGYEDRAKKLLKEATGKTAPELDGPLWEAFRNDRRQRGTMAHSDREPSEAEATSSVETMIALTTKIDALPV